MSSRIWTRVVVSISYDDNYYTTGTGGNDKEESPRNVVSSLDVGSYTDLHTGYPYFVGEGVLHVCKGCSLHSLNLTDCSENTVWF